MRGFCDNNVSNSFFHIPPLQSQTLPIPPQQRSNDNCKNVTLTFCEETINDY